MDSLLRYDLVSFVQKFWTVGSRNVSVPAKKPTEVASATVIEVQVGDYVEIKGIRVVLEGNGCELLQQWFATG